MQVRINGSESKIADGCTIRQLLESRDLASSKVVVERNGVIVKSEEWGNAKLESGDQLEIIRFVGGG